MKYIIKNHDQRIFQNRFFDLKTKEPLSPIETQNYTILQVAESNYTHGFSIENHRQFCDLELTFSYTNGLQCGANDVYETLDKYGLYLSFRDETHALKCRKRSRFQTLAINIKDGPCVGLLDAIKEKAKSQRTIYISDIATCLTELLTEFTLSDAPFFESNLDSLITSALVKLTRQGVAETLEEIPAYDLEVSSVKTYLDTHFLQICSLEELSYALGYTYSHISKVFKNAYGLTPSAYLLAKKTEHACALLKDGAKLDEIADSLGYSTAFNFSRAFKKQTGLSPSAYRKKSKKAE